MDRILIILGKQWPQGIISHFTEAVFHNIRIVLLVFTADRM